MPITAIRSGSPPGPGPSPASGASLALTVAPASSSPASTQASARLASSRPTVSTGAPPARSRTAVRSSSRRLKRRSASQPCRGCPERISASASPTSSPRGRAAAKARPSARRSTSSGWAASQRPSERLAATRAIRRRRRPMRRRSAAVSAPGSALAVTMAARALAARSGLAQAASSLSMRGDPAPARVGSAPTTRRSAMTASGSPKPRRAKLEIEVVMDSAPPSMIPRLQQREVALALEGRDVALVRLPVPALVAQEVLEHVLAQRLGDQLGGLHGDERLVQVDRERLDAGGAPLRLGHLVDVVAGLRWQLVVLLDALHARGQHHGKGQVGVGGRVGQAQLDVDPVGAVAADPD